MNLNHELDKKELNSVAEGIGSLANDPPTWLEGFFGMLDECVVAEYEDGGYLVVTLDLAKVSRMVSEIAYNATGLNEPISFQGFGDRLVMRGPMIEEEEDED